MDKYSWRYINGLARNLVFAAGLISLFAPCAVAQTLTIGGTGSSIGLIRALAAEYGKFHPGVRFKLPKSLGSRGGIRALLAGAVDIATSSREPTEQELGAGAKAIAYAKTPGLFVTSHKSMKGVSSGDVASIFSRTVLNWPDGKAIHLVLRPRSESDTSYLQKAFPTLNSSLEDAWEKKEVPLAYTDQDNLEFALKYEDSFAFASLTTVLTEAPQLTRLTLDGVAPTVRNLELGVYRLSKTLYFVIRPPPTPLVQQFLAFVNSAAGASTLRAKGNLPYSR